MSKESTIGRELANEAIAAHVKELIDIGSDEQSYFLSLLKYRKLRRRQYILQADEVCRYETYVITGCMRSYFIDGSEAEHVVMFAVENGWIGDGLSFSSGAPSGINIDALEPCEIFQIDKPSLEALYKAVPAFERFFRIKFQTAFIAEQQRVICNFTRSAQDRYFTFLKRFPGLEQRIPQHQIASFLGITPQFLSQVKSIALKK
ncbi:MAG TPA: Crp/Fnr family transcriptional regulator [Flavitalea sp.]|nr:Crp/Fnr family transcriptional regulator [Flavitalea sp.]